MEAVLSLSIGYLLGAFNPANLLAKRRNVDLTQTGTKNLGASNALIVLGRSAGAIVMVLDIFKAWLAARIARRLFPTAALAWAIAAFGAIAGHVFPWHLHFRGGKGLAAFAGMILYHHWPLFFLLLAIGMVLMLLVNYSFIAPMSAAVLFPFFAAARAKSRKVFWVSAAASAIIIWKHWSNIGKALRGDDVRVREYIRDHLLPGGNS